MGIPFPRSIKTMKTHGAPYNAREVIHKTREAKIIAELKESGHSCLTCPNSDIAYGVKLHCKFKDSFVSQYNICEFHGKKRIKPKVISKKVKV